MRPAAIWTAFTAALALLSHDYVDVWLLTVAPSAFVAAGCWVRYGWSLDSEKPGRSPSGEEPGFLPQANALGVVSLDR